MQRLDDGNVMCDRVTVRRENGAGGTRRGEQDCRVEEKRGRKMKGKERKRGKVKEDERAKKGKSRREGRG